MTTHAITEFPDMMSNTYANQITTGPDGNLWFTSAATNDIGIFDPTTGAFTQVPVPARARTTVRARSRLGLTATSGS